mmetsp:Transcript_73468/g.212603  ORF Transcript_73468/g.212603 Transcript_73468/m.212603 type:complete len:324 (-) Transcript_73468:322-1293(-)
MPGAPTSRTRLRVQSNNAARRPVVTTAHRSAVSPTQQTDGGRTPLRHGALDAAPPIRLALLGRPSMPAAAQSPTGLDRVARRTPHPPSHGASGRCEGRLVLQEAVAELARATAAAAPGRDRDAQNRGDHPQDREDAQGGLRAADTSQFEGRGLLRMLTLVVLPVLVLLLPVLLLLVVRLLAMMLLLLVLLLAVLRILLLLLQAGLVAGIGLFHGPRDERPIFLGDVGVDHLALHTPPALQLAQGLAFRRLLRYALLGADVPPAIDVLLVRRRIAVDEGVAPRLPITGALRQRHRDIIASVLLHVLVREAPHVVVAGLAVAAGV